MVWKTLGKVCGALGVVLSAASIGLLEILPHPFDHVWLSVQAGIIALGVYAANLPPDQA